MLSLNNNLFVRRPDSSARPELGVTTLPSVSYDQLNEHGAYVADAVKIDAYRRALNRVVKPGDVVIDLGCGCGVLGLLALEAGAGRVIAVDRGPILELARETFEANGFGDRVDCRRINSSDLTLPTPADVLVCDQIGGFAHDVNITHNVNDLLDRGVLKPNAKIVPCTFDLIVAPVSAPPSEDPLRSWVENTTGFNLAPFHQSASNTPFRLTAKADWLLGPGMEGAELDSNEDENIDFEVTSQIHTAGTITGLLGYMRAHLDRRGGVTLTNDPTDPGHFRRWHVYHPVEPALQVEPGAEVNMKFTINQRGHVTNWQTSVGDETRSASQFFGDFLDPLVMFDPPGDEVPPLSRSGHCLRSVLDAIADGRPFADIVGLVTSDYGDQFGTPDEARRYARDMVASYCERT
jgi:protein arginine N-methyltransferase 1